jgi:hypothetical protein
MPSTRRATTQCSRDLFGYEVVEGGHVVAASDGGAVTSDAGALLLGATDRAIGLVTRFATCFADRRAHAQVEHSIEAMVRDNFKGLFNICIGKEERSPWRGSNDVGFYQPVADGATTPLRPRTSAGQQGGQVHETPSRTLYHEPDLYSVACRAS